MSRKNFDLSAYLVIGPENVKGRQVVSIIEDVVEAGFSCIQIRSKVASARELIEITGQAAEVIAKAGKSEEVALLVNDRLDVILAARRQESRWMESMWARGYSGRRLPRLSGGRFHYSLTARSHEMLEYIKNADVSQIDYFGIGPLRKSTTKPDCGLGLDGRVVTRSFEEISKIAEISPIPVVVGGGVKLDDIAQLAETGVHGFFVVSAVTEAEDPKEAAADLVKSWRLHGQAFESRRRKESRK